MIPSLSLVIPVHNAANLLEQCLNSLRDSDLQAGECIVVDDGSTDGSAEIAARYGATVLSTGGPFGPARARNLGARAARGDILVFLDADVLVHPDALSLFASEFMRDPDLDAVMGSYDNSPSAKDYISQFRNLMHCFVHRNSQRQATTFWTGCGAIRRKVFLDFGGFNEQYVSPSIEDIELGYRMTKAGCKMVLNVEIQVTHMKHWSFRNMMRTDFFYRAIPWSELSLRTGRMPNDLNLRISQRISVALVVILMGLAGFLVWHARANFLTPLLATLFILLSEYWTESTDQRSTSAITMMVAALAAIAFLSWKFHMSAIIPAVLGACLALFAQHRYAGAREATRRWTGVLVCGYLICAIGFVWWYLPWHPVACLFLLLLLTLLMLNKQFYTFLAADRGTLFAIAAVPFHLLYFASSAVAFMVAAIHFGIGRLVGSSLQTPPRSGSKTSPAPTPFKLKTAVGRSAGGRDRT